MATETAEKKLRISRVSAPADVTGIAIAEPEETVEQKKKNIIGVEQEGTGQKIAEIMKNYGTGEYYLDFWNKIKELGLQDTPLKYKFKEGFVIDYVKDPDTGKELTATGWEIPDMSGYVMKSEEKKIEPFEPGVGEGKTIEIKKLKVSKKPEEEIAGGKKPGFQAGGIVDGSPIKTDEKTTKQNMMSARQVSKAAPTTTTQKTPAPGIMLPPKGEHGKTPKISVSRKWNKQGFEKGGLVSNKKMTGAQILKEYGVDKPGDDATVYDVVIEDGRLKSATPNKEESARFSRVVSTMGTDRTGIGTGNERNQAALQYEDKPNVGAASGAGFCKGGKVKMQEGGEVPPEESTPAPVSAESSGAETPAPEAAPETSGDMTGPFESFSKVNGIDTNLIVQGNSLFTKLDNAVSGGNIDEANRFLDELRQFIADVDSAKSEAVGKANDTSLAAAYKEMANDARDLMSAFENMIGDVESLEATAGRTSKGESPEGTRA